MVIHDCINEENTWKGTGYFGDLLANKYCGLFLPTGGSGIISRGATVYDCLWDI